MFFDFREIATATMVLFAVIDIVGSIPLIIDLRSKVGHLSSGKAAIVAGAIMITFLFVGESILSLIGVELKHFAIAGSLVLFFLALEMILGIRIYRDQMQSTASIVPLAFPLIAGPGVMTSLLSLRTEFMVQNIIVAIVLNLMFTYAVLKLSQKIERFLGLNGIAIIRKVFGVILLAISVKLFTSNLGI